jgi:hypothetical protein
MTLVEDIRNSVDSMKHKQIDKLYKGTSIELDTPLHHEVRKVIEKVLWKEAPDLMDKMPEKWCKMEDSVQVIFQYEPPSNSTNIQFEVSNEDKLKLPPTYSRYGRDCVIGKSDATPLIKEWLAGIKDEDSAKRETKDMFDGIKEQLTSFMGKHASLNTALKEMPELKLYVPDIYLEKIEMKVERTAPKPKALTDDDVEVDVEALTRAAIAHRITSANN